MERRRFIATLAGGLLARGFAAEAQQAPRNIPRVGYVSGASDSRREQGFREGLRELEYVEGKTIALARAEHPALSAAAGGRGDFIIADAETYLFRSTNAPESVRQAARSAAGG